MREVSSSQLGQMRNALGLLHSKKPFRNRYFTSNKSENWNDLVDKGLAIKEENTDSDASVFFWLTREGAELALGRKISDKEFNEL